MVNRWGVPMRGELVIDIMDAKRRGEPFQEWLRRHRLDPMNTIEVRLLGSLIWALQYIREGGKILLDENREPRYEAIITRIEEPLPGA